VAAGDGDLLERRLEWAGVVTWMEVNHVTADQLRQP
jgi:hypothetical protein